MTTASTTPATCAPGMPETWVSSSIAKDVIGTPPSVAPVAPIASTVSASCRAGFALTHASGRRQAFMERVTEGISMTPSLMGGGHDLACSGNDGL